MNSRDEGAILIVEDDAGLRDLVGEVCGEFGLTVETASCGREALERLAWPGVTMMVLDNVLPDMNAVELLDAVSKDGSKPPPFVVITGAGSERLAVAMLHRGARDYLVKDSAFMAQLPVVLRRVMREVDTETQLRRAETDLRESEERWQFALEGAGDGVWDRDVMTGRVFYSRQWKAILGYAEHEIGDSQDEWERRIHPEDRASVHAALERHFRGETSAYEAEYRLRCKDGSFRWIMARGKTIRWTPEGKPLRIIGTHTDIAARKQGEQLIEIQRDLAIRLAGTTDLATGLRELLASLCRIDGIECGGVYLVDNETGTLDLAVHCGLSEAFVGHVARMVLHAPMVCHAVAGRPFYTVYSEVPGVVVDPIRAAEGLQALAVIPVMREGRVIAVVNVASKTLSRIPWQIRDALEALVAQAGQVIARIRTEDTLVESEERFQATVEQSVDGILLADAEFRIILWNKALGNIYGYGESEMLGRYVWDFHYLTTPDELRTPDRLESLKDLTLAMASDRQTQLRETIVQRADGEKRTIQVSGFPILVRGRTLYGAIVRDVTAHRNMENQLVQAGKMVALGTLVAGVAHEINNPTNAIMLTAGVLNGVCADLVPHLAEHARKNGDFTLGGLPYDVLKEELPRLVADVGGCAERIKRIVDDMKRFSRSEPLDLSKTVDLNEVVSAAMRLVESQTRSATRRLAVELSPDIRPIRGSFQRLEQVVINLVQNACLALPDKERGIRVETVYDAKSGVNILRVQDEGAGMSRETLANIGQPFFTTRRENGGTGLGLSVSQGIVRDHGGIMRFESEQGRGTTVTVILPGEGESLVGKAIPG